MAFRRISSSSVLSIDCNVIRVTSFFADKNLPFFCMHHNTKTFVCGRIELKGRLYELKYSFLLNLQGLDNLGGEGISLLLHLHHTHVLVQNFRSASDTDTAALFGADGHAIRKFHRRYNGIFNMYI